MNRNRELIDSKPVEFEKALTETLSKVKNIVTHDFLVIIISDFQRYRPELIKFITRISRHNDVILAKVYDPMEQSIPDRKLIAGDKEKQLLIDGNNAKLRTDFKNVFEDEFEQFKAKMKKHRIPVLSIDTVRETDVQIKEILKRT